jgi:hypothetical protein
LGLLAAVIAVVTGHLAKAAPTTPVRIPGLILGYSFLGFVITIFTVNALLPPGM